VAPEARDKVKQIFAETPDERYAGEPEFEPITVKPDLEYYGDDYGRGLLVVNGDTDLLEAEWDGTPVRQVHQKPRILDSPLHSE
jgi:hypothetical protein